MSIITWADVTNRYNVASDYATTSEGSVHIEYAEAQLYGALAGSFTVPFSSNNITAKDLVIDMAFANTQKFKDTEKYQAMLKHFEEVTEKLISGGDGMVLDTNDVVYAIGTKDTGKVYSNTQDFPPIMDMGDIMDMHVSSDQLQSEYNAKL